MKTNKNFIEKIVIGFGGSVVGGIIGATLGKKKAENDFKKIINEELNKVEKHEEEPDKTKLKVKSEKPDIEELAKKYVGDVGDEAIHKPPKEFWEGEEKPKSGRYKWGDEPADPKLVNELRDFYDKKPEDNENFNDDDNDDIL